MNAFKTQEGKKEVIEYYDMLLNEINIPYSSVMVLPDAGHSLTGLSGEIIGFLMKQ